MDEVAGERDDPERPVMEEDILRPPGKEVLPLLGHPPLVVLILVSREDEAIVPATIHELTELVAPMLAG